MKLVPSSDQADKNATADLVSNVIDQLSREPSITATDVAEKALERLDPGGKSSALTREAALAALREEATRQLTGLYEPNSRSTDDLLKHANALEKQLGGNDTD